jgi:hypothetical protein
MEFDIEIVSFEPRWSASEGKSFFGSLYTKRENLTLKLQNVVTATWAMVGRGDAVWF